MLFRSECSGYYEVPRISDTWSSQMVEISIHSVTADGSSQEEAIRNWQVVAKNYNKAAAASATLCSPDAIPVQDMKAACETVMRQGVNHSDYDRARMLLEVLERTSLSGASQTDTPVGQRAPSKEGTLA